MPNEKLVESVEEALRADRKPYKPETPNASYTVPRPDLEEGDRKELMQTSHVKPGGELSSPEGWVRYHSDRVLYEVVDSEGNLCLVKESFPLHDHELWTFPSKQLGRNESLDTLGVVAEQVSESFASIKYHDLRTRVAKTSDTSLLNGREVLKIKCTQEGITDFVNSEGAQADPAVLAELYRLMLRLEGHTLPTKLPILRDKYAGHAVQRSMEETTGNWFKFIMVDAEGKSVEVVLSSAEAIALGITVQGYIILMRELSPMTGRNELIAVSGGVKADENSFEASVREMEEEVRRTGTPTQRISTMYANPQVFSNESHLHVIPNPVGYLGDVKGDEVNPPDMVVIHRRDLPELIKKGEIIDDRTLAAILLGLAYADAHPEIFL